MQVIAGFGAEEWHDLMCLLKTAEEFLCTPEGQDPEQGVIFQSFLADT